jgi:Holliday junction resolvase RusA-like endonuclease
MTKQAKELKASYVEQIKEQYDGCILSDMGMVKIKLHFPDRRKRDWDNYHKLSMDALE